MGWAVAIVVAGTKAMSRARARRSDIISRPLATGAAFWLTTRSGQRVSMDQIGSIFGRE